MPNVMQEPRVSTVTPEKASKEVKELYDALQKKMGRLPNMVLHLGHSSEALKAFINMSGAASHTSLNPKLREEIALSISQIDNCTYCLAAHSALARSHGVPDQEILMARKGEAKDPKTQAILKFAKSVIEKRGHVSDEEVKMLRAAGVSEKELVEIILVISESVYTNYLNIILNTAIDYPEVPELK